jgi:hypothetical protein
MRRGLLLEHRNERGKGAGLQVVVQLKVCLPELSESVLQNNCGSGGVISDRTCFAFARRLLV